MQKETWIWVPASVLLVATIIAINLLGEGIRDAFDPKMAR
jgi:peptide/nickel transport system permease protein